MTRTRRQPARLAREIAANVGSDAYDAAFTRFEDGHALHALEAVKVAQTGIDVLITQAVALARSTDATWEEIATALGLNSKQAAQQRYGTLSGS